MPNKWGGCLVYDRQPFLLFMDRVAGQDTNLHVTVILYIFMWWEAGMQDFLFFDGIRTGRKGNV